MTVCTEDKIFHWWLLLCYIPDRGQVDLFPIWRTESNNTQPINYCSISFYRLPEIYHQTSRIATTKWRTQEEDTKQQQQINVTRQQTRIFELTHEAYVPASRIESTKDFLSFIYALYALSTLDITIRTIIDIF